MCFRETTVKKIMIVIGTIDQHYTTHTCTCTYQCLLHCHALNSLFTFPKFFLLPLHDYCYKSLECTSNVVQQLLSSKYTLFMVMISVDLWVCVIVQQLPILQTQCTIVIEHLIPSLLSIPITSPSNRMCNCVTVHWSHTCICIHMCSHTSHTHTLTCIIAYLTTHSLQC